LKKLNQNKIKGETRKILADAMLVTVAGIAAAMKNTG
jgi:phosphoenolpyruvate carboxylase